MQSDKKNRLFGTDGIRGRAGEFPLDENTVEMIGWSLTENLRRELGHAPKLIIGRDTRESGAPIQMAMQRGATAAGASVASAGVITTPGVAFITRHFHFDAGVVISASHNPYRDNGIKVFSPSGKKIADAMERNIEADLAAANYASHPLHAHRKDWSEATATAYSEAAYADSYVQFLVNEVAEGLSLKGKRLAIDCANGAACGFAPAVFQRLGAAIEVINAAPDGRNINENCGALHLQALQALVQSGGFDVGVAFDGDADRALFVDENGAIVDGDHTLLLLGENLRKQGRLNGDLLVSTVMSNIGLEIALRERGIELVRAQVGDRYVLEAMETRNANLGGEQSGHIIIKEISLAGDGLITAIELLRALMDSGNSLAALAAAMKTYPQILVNVAVKSKPVLETLPAVKAAMAALTEEMQGKGRLLVRYSGTENLARVMIEGEDQAIIEAQAHRLAAIIKQAIG
ncbi:MAG: phosphoglucosamine mutase [Acidobacteria bacterium]|nr:phosphoglucosamine mutase [Acidobacteriota bacterium]